MNQIRLFDSRLPQMLQGAIIFSYFNAFWGIIGLLSGATAFSLIWIASALGAVGIANHRKWGYYLCLVASVLYLVLIFLLWSLNFGIIFNILFGVFLVALLLHPMSQAYVRRYFR
jgi:hypothetical protein